jgi:hypothetical protein
MAFDEKAFDKMTRHHQNSFTGIHFKSLKKSTFEVF